MINRDKMTNGTRSQAMQRSFRRRGEEGSVALETAVVSMVGWFFIAACIDFVRYLTAVVLLTQGAQSALLLARTIEGLDRCTSQSYPGSCPAAFTTARTTIINRSKQLPLQTIFSESAGAPQQLLTPELILPGVAQHPMSYCQTYNGTSDTLANLFLSCPVVIKVSADVRFMLPLLGTKRVEVQVSGLRESALSSETAFPETQSYPL